jgi:hypothetical protein
MPPSQLPPRQRNNASMAASGRALLFQRFQSAAATNLQAHALGKLVWMPEQARHQATPMEAAAACNYGGRAQQNIVPYPTGGQCYKGTNEMIAVDLVGKWKDTTITSKLRVVELFKAYLKAVGTFSIFFPPAPTPPPTEYYGTSATPGTVPIIVRAAACPIRTNMHWSSKLCITRTCVASHTARTAIWQCRDASTAQSHDPTRQRPPTIFPTARHGRF